MEFDRSIDMKTAEAVLAIYRGDDTVRGYVGGRIYLGPQIGQDSAIVTPQVSVSPAPTPFDPGVDGVSNVPIAVLVLLFEPLQRRPFEEGRESSACRIRRLQALLSRGSLDPSSNAYDTQGRLIDPDNATSSDATQKYLTLTSPTFTPWQGGYYTAPGASAPCANLFTFLAGFETRLDNITRLRA